MLHLSAFDMIVEKEVVCKVQSNADSQEQIVYDRVDIVSTDKLW